MNDFEKTVIEMLKKGLNQREISLELKKTKSYHAHSLSNIEKLINALKKKYGAKTMFQLGMMIEKLKI